MNMSKEALPLEEVMERLEENEEVRRSGIVLEYDEDEVYNAKHGQLTPSSAGLIGPPYSKKPNPLIKAIGTQRKDFDYVTNLRREVIEIVEPYRAKVIASQKRFELMEKTMEDLSAKVSKFEVSFSNQLRTFITSERVLDTFRTTKIETQKLVEEVSARVSKQEIRIDVHH